MTTRFLQDILNEPGELSRSLAYTLGPGRPALERAADLARGAAHLTLTGIGSSWHAGMAMLSVLDAAGVPARLADASELLHFARLPPGSALVILSRSGKSVEVVRLLDKAAAAGARVIGVTNTPDSPLGARADVVVRVNAAFDHLVSVSMYSALALVGALLAAAIAGDVGEELESVLHPALVAAREAIPGWQARIADNSWFEANAPTYFLARGGSLASCHEARLLWEEAAKAPAAAMMTGCFRHGPQEVLAPGLRIGLWLDGERLREEDLALVRDLRAYGAQVMLIGQAVPEDAADLVLPLPETAAAWQFLVDIMPAQLAAEHLSRLRGIDPDTFRICPYIIEAEGGLTTSSPSAESSLA